MLPCCGAAVLPLTATPQNGRTAAREEPMIQFCYVCKRVYGEKEPFDDSSVSHGICEECVPLEAARIEGEMAAIEGDHVGSPLQTAGGGR